MIAVAVALVAGCRSAPVLNVNEAPVVVTSNKAVTNEAVRDAIVRAGRKLGWQMSEAGAGLVRAHIALRTHTADADVRYTTKTFSIVYRDSTGLDAANGQIHKNYNGWIQNLDREIRSELLLL